MRVAARLVEAEDPDCLSPAEAAELLAGAPWERLVVLGDSVAAGIREPTAGYRDAGVGERFAEILAAARPAAGAWNLAVPGLRVAEIRDGQLAAALRLRPDLAILAAGGNDALARSFDADRLERELRDLVEPLASSGALVVTIGLFDLARSGLVPPEYAEAMARRFDLLDEITRRVCAVARGVHVDNHRHRRSADEEIFSSDRIHANARGHAIATANLVRALHAHLARLNLGSANGEPPPHAAQPRRAGGGS